MYRYSFIIYGVFDGDVCLMVGSTSQLLHKRAKGYQQYSWYSPIHHKHRILWSGEIAVCDKEQALFIRAAKEASWISKMKTWWPEGKNQANPIKQAMGTPFTFFERDEIRKKRARLGRARWRKENPELAFAASSRAGKKGGSIGGRKGGKRVRELYPGMAERNGRKQGLINVESGLLKTIAAKGRHSRWHKIKKNAFCIFCQKEAA